MKTFRQFTSSAMLVALTLAAAFSADTTLAPPAVTAGTRAENPLRPDLPTIWIAGDSTAARGNPDAAGWAVPMPESFFPKDHTHTNAASAEPNAALAVQGLRTLPGAPIDALLTVKGRAPLLAR